MARIRSIKPEFFKHEELQDLEANNPGQYVMLVFSGLWTQCDKNGVFPYRVKILKNEILPFIDFDMEKTLALLEEKKFFRRFEHEGKVYGHVINFKKYQCPSKYEKEAPAKYPLPSEDIKQSDRHVSENVSENVSEHMSEHVSELDGILNPESGILNNGILNPDSCASENDFSNNPQKLFLHIWQTTPNIFNALAGIQSTKDWKRFWSTSPPTCEEVRQVMQNVIDDVKSGDLHPRFIAKTPDKFVLNGGFIRHKTRYAAEVKKTSPPSPDMPDQSNKKSLEG